MKAFYETAETNVVELVHDGCSRHNIKIPYSSEKAQALEVISELGKNLKEGVLAIFSLATPQMRGDDNGNNPWLLRA